MNALVIPSRFCGPPRSGNGGWTAGALAAHTLGDRASDTPVQVTLRVPPPLDTPLSLRSEGGRTLLEHDGTLVAEAETSTTEIARSRPVRPADALRATAAHPGVGIVEYASCFSCGSGRAEGDGLRILPGPLADDPQGRFAAPWTPHPSTASTLTQVGAGSTAHADLACTWAALDCIGGWADDLLHRPMLLGRMTAQVTTLPRIGEEHVLVGEVLRRDGRRSYTVSALFDAEGNELARAHHVWFAVDLSAYS